MQQVSSAMGNTGVDVPGVRMFKSSVEYLRVHPPVFDIREFTSVSQEGVDHSLV
jgi:hypothetical protein